MLEVAAVVTRWCYQKAQGVGVVGAWRCPILGWYQQGYYQKAQGVVRAWWVRCQKTPMGGAGDAIHACRW